MEVSNARDFWVNLKKMFTYSSAALIKDENLKLHNIVDVRYEGVTSSQPV